MSGRSRCVPELRPAPRCQGPVPCTHIRASPTVSGFCFGSRFRNTRAERDCSFQLTSSTGTAVALWHVCVTSRVSNEAGTVPRYNRVAVTGCPSQPCPPVLLFPGAHGVLLGHPVPVSVLQRIRHWLGVRGLSPRGFWAHFRSCPPVLAVQAPVGGPGWAAAMARREDAWREARPHRMSATIGAVDQGSPDKRNRGGEGGRF